MTSYVLQDPERIHHFDPDFALADGALKYPGDINSLVRRVQPYRGHMTLSLYAVNDKEVSYPNVLD